MTVNPTPTPRDLTPHDLTAREVYCCVVDVPDFERRQRLLRQLCSGRPDVMQRVERLLEARQHAGDGLLARIIGVWQNVKTEAAGEEISATCSDASSVSPGSDAGTSSEPDGQSFGPYWLLEILGEGGMGTVYRAQQRAPLKREVALKVIRPELCTDAAIARFAQERQSMALMEHPNIATVFDSGVTDDGRHYLVMELIRGVPLDEYCIENQLSIEERLTLFADLGRAIQHAHSKNIIHRDLKPRNILVANLDGQPMLKVIDFGIAKPFGPPQGAELEETRAGQILGTPLYQAPEQLDANQGAVDVRCDIYALGVVLYRLLTDTTPIDRDVVAKAGFDALLRTIREQDYDAPSARVRKIAKSAQPASPKPVLLSLPKRRQHTLDWITVKALHPEPDGRYRSVEEMLEDLARYSRHEPISAGPPQRLIGLPRWIHQKRSALFIAVILSVVFAGSLYVVLRRPDSGKKVARANNELQLDPAADWREASRLQAAMSAFRDSDDAALRASFVGWSPESLAEATTPNARERTKSTSSSRVRFSLPRLLYDVAHPKPATVLADSADIQAADYSRESGRLLVATKTGELRLYSSKEGVFSRPPTVIGKHPGRVDALAISPDGSRAVSGTNRLWFWNLDRATIDHKGESLGAGIESIAWSPDGKTVAAGARYETVWVGDRSGRELFRVPNNHRHETILFAPDSQSLFIPTRKGIDEYRIASGRRLRTIDVLPLEIVRTMTLVGPNQNLLMIGDRFHEFASVIDVSSGETVGSLPLEGQYPQCFRSADDGQCLAVLYPNGKCSLLRLSWDPRDNIELGRRLVFQIFPPRPLADNDRLELLWVHSGERFVTLGGQHAGQLWDCGACDPVQVKKAASGLLDVLPAAADQIVQFPGDFGKTGCRANFVAINGQSPQPLGDQLSEPTGIFSEYSRNQLVASLGKNAIEIVDLRSGAILARIECAYVPGKRRISLSDDGSTVGVAVAEQVLIWKTDDRWSSWRSLPPFDLAADTIFQLTSEGDSICVEAASTVQEYHITSRRLINSYDDKHPDAPWTLSIDDEHGIVIIGKRDQLSIFQRESHDPSHQFPVDSEILSLLPTADPAILLSGHRDGTVRAWHLHAKKPLGILFRPFQYLGEIRRLVCFPDRNRILAVAKKGSDLTSIIIGNAQANDGSMHDQTN